MPNTEAPMDPFGMIIELLVKLAASGRVQGQDWKAWAWSCGIGKYSESYMWLNTLGFRNKTQLEWHSKTWC
jgi:hypothetical protein